jgi:hypothetical protein
MASTIAKHHPGVSQKIGGRKGTNSAISGTEIGETWHHHLLKDELVKMLRQRRILHLPVSLKLQMRAKRSGANPSESVLDDIHVAPLAFAEQPQGAVRT